MSTVQAKIYLKELISNLENNIVPYQSIMNQCQKALNELEERGVTMIDEKRIKEAATKHMNKKYCDDIKSQCELDFKAGAEWAQKEFIKSLWHDPEEEPIKLSELILHNKCDDTYYATNVGWISWDVYKDAFDVDRWLYIPDLLPKEQ